MSLFKNTVFILLFAWLSPLNSIAASDRSNAGSFTENGLNPANFSLQLKVVKKDAPSTQGFQNPKRTSDILTPAKTSRNIPFDFDKFPNPFWKIGGLFFVAGLFVLVISFSVFWRLSFGFSSLWLMGMLAGLALIVVSLPFLLLGALLGKRKKSDPGDDLY
jgi:hypothetical protein